MEAVFKVEPAFDKHADIHPNGWEKIRVTYSVEFFSGISYLSWKVFGTDHVFRIPSQIVYENHGLDYTSHFLKTLEVFRTDYLQWKEAEFREAWMKNYERQFSNLIK